MSADTSVAEFSRRCDELHQKLLETQKELAATQHRLEQVALHAPLLLWTADDTGSIDWSNRGWFEFAGAAKAGPHRVFSMMHPDDAPSAKRHFERARAMCQPATFEARLRRRDGKHLWHEVRVVPLPRSKGKAEWLGCCMDIEAAKKRQQRLSAAESEARRMATFKDAFLRKVSHELRTPLQAILGWVGLLRGGQLESTRFPQALHAIERNARMQSELIAKIVESSRILTSEVLLRVQPVELASITERVLARVRSKAAEAKISLEASLEGAADRVLVDPERIAQALENLMHNAIECTPPGGRVHLLASTTPSTLSFIVRDTGKGIAKDRLPSLFEQHLSTEAADLNEHHRGLGLGLAVVQRLIGLHGGTVTVASEGSGCGTQFCITLPAAGPPRFAARAASDVGVPDATAAG